MKCKLPRPGFELGSLCPFPMMVTIAPNHGFILMSSIMESGRSFWPKTTDTRTLLKAVKPARENNNRSVPGFHMIDNLLIAVHAFGRPMLTSFSVNEILLPSDMNLSTNFRSLTFIVETAPSRLKHIYSVLLAIMTKLVLNYNYFCLVWFLCLTAYQLLWVI